MGFFDPFGGSGSSGSGGAGMPGKDGRGISTITFLSSSKGSTAGITGATDTYQITYTDGTKSTFVVKNGEAGESGERGLTGPQGPAGTTPIFKVVDDKIQVSTDEGKTYSSLIPLSDITGPQGEQGIQGEKGDKGDTGEKGDKGDTGEKGNKGDTGIGISSIVKTTNYTGSAVPNIIRVTMTDGSNYDFTVYNGHSGDNVELRNDGSSIQWRPVDAEGNATYMWTDIIRLNDIRGPQGETGEQGIQGEKGEQGDPAKVRYVNTILKASEWVDGTYTLTSEYFQGDNYINVGTHKDTTLAQYDALAAAKIICVEQSEGKIVLKSLGLIPSIDAPITIIIEGEQLNNVTDTYLMTDETTGIVYKMGINNGTTYFEEYTE